MQAKLKSEYRFGKSLLALGRIEFVKDEWRDVPIGKEDEASRHEWLETRADPEPEPEEVAPSADTQLQEMLEGEKPSAEAILESMDAEAETGNISETATIDGAAVTPEVEQPEKKRRTGRRSKEE